MAERPTATEVARTLTAGHGTASIGTAFGATSVPVLHAGLEDGEVVLLAGRRDLAALELGELLTDGRRDRVVLLDIRSYAPLADLTLLRAHLSLAGRVRVVRPEERADATAALVAALGPEVATHTAPWSDRALLLLEVAEGELHWPHGCTPLDAEDYVLADPDPVAADEGPALDRLARSCSERLLGLVRGLRRPATGDDDLTRATSVRPVGLDRYGLTLRCTLPDGESGLGRLSFPEPQHTVAGAERAVTALLDHHEHCRLTGTTPP